MKEIINPKCIRMQKNTDFSMPDITETDYARGKDAYERKE